MGRVLRARRAAWRAVSLVTTMGLVAGMLAVLAPGASASPGITVKPTTGLVTSEAGGTATFAMRLNTKPQASVSVGLSSSDPSEGKVSPASVTFTRANWDTPHKVTVTGVDDFVDDGRKSYSIVTARATSTDPVYKGLNAANVSVANTDDDTAGITVTPTAGLVTTEAGGTDTFKVRLNSRPIANVGVGLSSSNPAEGTVAPISLTFTKDNWNTLHTVTVTGVSDLADDGPKLYSIVTAAAISTDPHYQGLNAANVSVANADSNDRPTTVDFSVSTDEQQGVSIDLAGHASDAETTDANLHYTIESGPAHGNLTGSGGSRTYTPSTDYNGSDTITFSVTDRGDPDNCGAPSASCADTKTSTIAMISITVKPVNDAPTLTGTSTLDYTENDPATPINTGIVVADVDNATLASATVSITNNFVSGEDVLAFTNSGMGNIAATYNAGTGVLSLTSAGATATLAQWRAALRAVTYENTNLHPSTASRTVRYVVNDGSLPSNQILSTVKVIDNSAPTVTGVSSTTAAGSYKAGASISIQVAFSEAVFVTGTPSLALDSGASAEATYVSGSGTNTLTFTYVVSSGDTSADLDYDSVSSLTGTIKDAAANAADRTLPTPGAAGSLGANEALVIDTSAPTVDHVNSTTADGTYNAGASISIRVVFSEAVVVTGTPSLALNSGASAEATYVSGSGTDTLTFTYVVSSGDASTDLDYDLAASLVGTIKDAATNAAVLTLPDPGAAGSLGANADLVIDGSV